MVLTLGGHGCGGTTPAAGGGCVGVPLWHGCDFPLSCGVAGVSGEDAGRPHGGEPADLGAVVECGVPFGGVHGFVVDDAFFDEFTPELGDFLGGFFIDVHAPCLC